MPVKCPCCGSEYSSDSLHARCLKRWNRRLFILLMPAFALLIIGLAFLIFQGVSTIVHVCIMAANLNVVTVLLARRPIKIEQSAASPSSEPEN